MPPPDLTVSPWSWIDREACQEELVFKWWYSEISAARSTPWEAICSEEALALSSPRQGELASAEIGSQSIFEWMSDLLGCYGHSYSKHPAVSLTGGLASNVEKKSGLLFFLTNACLLESICKQNKMTQSTSTREGPHILWLCHQGHSSCWGICVLGESTPFQYEMSCSIPDSFPALKLGIYLKWTEPFQLSSDQC